MTPATSSGPISAPVWSSALCTPKPRPRPTSRAATASSTDLAGLRTALPVRSSSTIAEPQTRPAAPSAGASAISGTQAAVRA